MLSGRLSGMWFCSDEEAEEKLYMTAHLFPSRPAHQICLEALTFLLNLEPRLFIFIYSLSNSEKQGTKVTVIVVAGTVIVELIAMEEPAPQSL